MRIVYKVREKKGTNEKRGGRGDSALVGAITYVCLGLNVFFLVSVFGVSECIVVCWLPESY